MDNADAELTRYQNSIDGKLELLGANDSCKNCRQEQGKVVALSDVTENGAMKEKPVKNCTRNDGCRCYYMVIVADPPDLSLIENFVAHYIREFVYFEKLAKTCEQNCQMLLANIGIKASVISRGKTAVSLEKNLRQQNATIRFRSAADIYAKNRDLAGVRITAFDSLAMSDIDVVIRKNYVVVDHKSFTGKYLAEHYIVKTDETGDHIEIQVRALVVGTYEDVEHFAWYKAWQGVKNSTLENDLNQLREYALSSQKIVDRIFRQLESASVRPRSSDVFPSGQLEPGTVVKGSGASVYYVGTDRRRYVFPTEITLRTWFPDIEPISVKDEALIQVPIGGNVTYKPGTRLIKTDSNKDIFAVENGGVLRRIISEKLIEDLYGINWKDLVDILPDAYIVNYSAGPDILSKEDHDPEQQRMNTEDNQVQRCC